MAASCTSIRLPKRPLWLCAPGAPLVQGTKQLPLVRAGGLRARLVVRHDGPAVVQSGAPAGDYRPARCVSRPTRAAAGKIAEYSGYATMIFMIGWASGGVLFGILGDRLGRAKTMVMTILFYSIFTGLSVFSTSVWDFSVYRFLTGLGVGGQFAVGVALVAEVMPPTGAALRVGLGASSLCCRQHDGSRYRYHPRADGTIGRDRQRLANDVRSWRSARVPDDSHLQTAERTRGMAAGAPRQGADGLDDRPLHAIHGGEKTRSSA